MFFYSFLRTSIPCFSVAISLNVYSSALRPVSQIEQVYHIYRGIGPPAQLVVMPKHSMGAVDPISTVVEQTGKDWLRKYLAKLGKEKKDMAQESKGLSFEPA